MKCLEMMVVMMITKKVLAHQVAQAADLQVGVQVKVELRARRQRKKERWVRFYIYRFICLKLKIVV